MKSRTKFVTALMLVVIGLVAGICVWQAVVENAGFRASAADVALASLGIVFMIALYATTIVLFISYRRSTKATVICGSDAGKLPAFFLSLPRVRRDARRRASWSFRINSEALSWPGLFS